MRARSCTWRIIDDYLSLCKDIASQRGTCGIYGTSNVAVEEWYGGIKPEALNTLLERIGEGRRMVKVGREVSEVSEVSEVMVEGKVGLTTVDIMMEPSDDGDQAADDHGSSKRQGEQVHTS